MHKLEKSYQVIISGGGPVGLFLGCCLYRLGVSFIILEKRERRITHSRSLGIHPVSLELFEKLNLANIFINAGIKIKKGHAFSDTGKIGSISFDQCPKPYNFILSLPQYKTEEILENHLLSLNPDVLAREYEVKHTDENRDRVSVTVRHTKSGNEDTLQCKFLAGCDGKESIVRKEAGIDFKGSSYPDTYIMGDFTDNTNFENDAAIFLSRKGLVESFPLTNNKRRWVIKTDSYINNVSRLNIEALIADRIGHDISEEENQMLSSFGVQKLIADPMSRGRIALAGDAAHIVSPIGGQGMNLGWLDAWDLATVLADCLTHPESDYQKELNLYSRRRTSITKKTIKRSELNMKLGRKTSLPFFRNSLVWIMLNTPLKKVMAKLFTMRNLDNRFF